MPYLSSGVRRAALEPQMRPQDGAELNYVICRLIDRYIADAGLRYPTLQAIDGALDLAKAEFQRRVVEPYEQMKLFDNGEVFIHAYPELMKLAYAHPAVDAGL